MTRFQEVRGNYWLGRKTPNSGWCLKNNKNKTKQNTAWQQNKTMFTITMSENRIVTSHSRNGTNLCPSDHYLIQVWWTAQFKKKKKKSRRNKLTGRRKTYHRETGRYFSPLFFCPSRWSQRDTQGEKPKSSQKARRSSHVTVQLHHCGGNAQQPRSK